MKARRQETKPDVTRKRRSAQKAVKAANIEGKQSLESSEGAGPPKLAKAAKTKGKSGRKSRLTNPKKKPLLGKRSARARRRPPTRKPFPDDEQLRNRFESFAALFSSSWGEFAWDLYCANDTRGVKEVFRCLRAQGFDSYLDDLRYEFEEPATTKMLRQTQNLLHQWDLKVCTASKEHEESLVSVREAKTALQMVPRRTEKETRKEVVLKLKARRKRMWRARRKCEEIAKQMDEIYERMKRQRAYIIRKEILRFTASKRRAYTPQSLAMAVAGLPHVAWRQSAGRCREFPDPPIQSHYRIFEAIKSVLKRCVGRFSSEFASEMILMIFDGKKTVVAGEILRINHNRDALQRASEEYANVDISKQELPYRVAGAFNRNLRNPRSALENVLTRKE